MQMRCHMQVIQECAERRIIIQEHATEPCNSFVLNGNLYDLIRDRRPQSTGPGIQEIYVNVKIQILITEDAAIMLLPAFSMQLCDTHMIRKARVPEGNHRCAEKVKGEIVMPGR